ncbi:MAG TPA: hypothetical protein VF395_00550 [Polyangiaceae bacterium]
MTRILGTSSALLVPVVFLFAGCSDGKSMGGAPKLVFDTDVRTAYAPARACRSPGEHSGLNAFSVWVSPGALPDFDRLWEDPPGIARLPDGAVVVKEVYSGAECKASEVERWVAMQKEKGFDPAHADWHWQEVTAKGTVTTDGAATACINCHRGGDDGSCIGYGEEHGRDYTCTVADVAGASPQGLDGGK